MDRIIFYFILLINLFQLCELTKTIAYNIPDPDCTGAFNLCTDHDKERLGRQAIKTIHEQMDDDKDGMIEASESRDFIKDDLENKTDPEQHSRFQNADLQITLNDLWTQWKHSAVYNWTNDQVIHWLVHHIHLPEYVENFQRNQIDGRMIPRLAANEKHYLSAIMQIRDPRHKRRLIIKTTDVVLFGAPQPTHNLIKDIILISALLISIAACVYAFIRHRKTQESMKLMLKELETLQKAGGDLVAVTGKMKAMENEMKDKTKVDRGLLNSWFNEVQRTKEEAEKYRKRRDSTVDHGKQFHLALQEIEQLRIALRKAEEHARHQSYEAPSELIDLLKRTYHMEELACEIKRKSAENAMLIAKEQMNKISKMQKGFFGAVRIAHTGCIDNISELINAAKERLADAQEEYEEREKRWNRIGSLLDREDLISNSSSSTTSTAANPYLTGSPLVSLNNGTNNNVSSVFRIRGSDGRLFTGTIDAANRSKQTSFDSNNDSLSINKNNSNINNRGVSLNTLCPTQISYQDPISQGDNGFEQSNSASTLLKRRTTPNSTFSNNRSSAERLVNSSTMIYSNSITGLNDPNIISTGMVRPNTFEALDITPSAMRHTKTVYDIIPDLHLDTNNFIFDDPPQQQSHTLDSSYDDQRSTSSADKIQKSTTSKKLFRPFHNLRFRKKNTAT